MSTGYVEPLMVSTTGMYRYPHHRDADAVRAGFPGAGVPHQPVTFPVGYADGVIHGVQAGGKVESSGNQESDFHLKLLDGLPHGEGAAMIACGAWGSGKYRTVSPGCGIPSVSHHLWLVYVLFTL